ncbi:PD40 domain-containing protein [Fulvivirgaceae bacterium PWU4]|uniref:PD40 domain-containing protein n=1 Tax=Chryseosolibacter histidini TaxID=2782349 RepID=A0AAP2GRD9_9BACT|nr:OmpA family protein [Chryseosolibacter histidini]MBT1701063.1 PD40 domain-containing protein [Chryseosolibacter histidini]
MRYTGFALLIIVLLAACSAEKKANKAFRLGKYQNTIDIYKKKLANDPNDGKANFYVAESYRLSNRLKEAEPYYAKAGGRGLLKDSIQFFLAEAQKANGKYDEARKTLEAVIASTPDEKFKNRLEAYLNGIDYLEKLNERRSYYKVKNLELINTPSAEYSPVFLNNELYFTSSRGNGKVYEATGTPFTDIYKVASRGANVDLATVATLPEGINSENINDGCITFSPDGKIMVFAKGNSGKRKGTNDVDLYLTRFRNGAWTEPVALNINDPDAWDSSPAFSPDGRTLYFASNRKGRARERAGYGGTDIYSAQMDSRGRFSRVRNLGPEINTAGNELFPYVAEDAKLYFASDGHPGYGGLDLFVVKRVNGKTVIENLAQPVNSNGDDFAIFLFRADRGFFTSNRDGGKGDDDIYTFINEDPNLKVVNYYLQGVTYTPDSVGKLRILPNTKVSLIDHNGDVMQDFVTGNDGKFLFRIYENEDYNLIAETDGYLVKRQAYTTRGRGVDPSTLKELVTNITLDTMVVLDKIDLNKYFVLDNIYYDLDKANIRPDAAKELDKLVQLLIDNPEIKIELSSHTDSIATVEYNQDLSQRRAESAVKYLVDNGISPDRLVAKGYGELRPIARNTNPDGTDNPEGRDRNRRTEFKILEVGVIPKTIEEEEEFDEDKYFKSDGNN